MILSHLLSFFLEVLKMEVILFNGRQIKYNMYHFLSFDICHFFYTYINTFIRREEKDEFCYVFDVNNETKVLVLNSYMSYIYFFTVPLNIDVDLFTLFFFCINLFTLFLYHYFCCISVHYPLLHFYKS